MARATAAKPLQGVRILSLALNLPGPAALMRLRRLGAVCTKLEPPPPVGAVSADPMVRYAPHAYAQLHDGIRVLHADLKSSSGKALLHRHLARVDVLITSFRPTALNKLGLSWRDLHRQHSALCHVAIQGETGPRAAIPGHDLTYMAEHGLIQGLSLPTSLYADMAGSLAACEATLALLWQRAQPGPRQGQGARREVGLSESAHHLSLPWHWGLTQPDGIIGGAHAGYRVYACQDGRVAVAALEPHFARRLCAVAGISDPLPDQHLMTPKAQRHLNRFFARHTQQALRDLAQAHDLPLHTMAP